MGRICVMGSSHSKRVAFKGLEEGTLRVRRKRFSLREAYKLLGVQL